MDVLLQLEGVILSPSTKAYGTRYDTVEALDGREVSQEEWDVEAILKVIEKRLKLESAVESSVTKKNCSYCSITVGRRGHKAKECRSPHKCSACGRKHHVSVPNTSAGALDSSVARRSEQPPTASQNYCCTFLSDSIPEQSTFR
ncbi:hypothetical protein EMCRGX_G003635 [Ephydatia muelleri]